MAKLSRIVSPGAEQDYLPNFMTWSSQDNGFEIFDSYLGHLTGGHNYTSSELWNAYSGWTSTSSNISSNSSSYWIQSISCNTQDGNMLLSVPAKGGRNVPFNRNPDTIAGWWSRNASIIHEPGVRNPWSIHLNNNYWALTVRGSTGAWDSVDGANGNYRDVGSFNSTYGSGSYNQRTRTLCIIMGSGSNNYRAYFWTHPTIDLMSKNLKGGQFSQFLSDAKAGYNGAKYFYNDFSWATSNSTGYNESQYKLKTIMGDNGVVGLMRMTPSNQTVSGYFTPTGVSGNGVSVTNLIALGLTTSYGWDNGDKYGAQHQVTWDASWVATYTPYYYYGSGFNIHFICAKDPSKQYYRQDGNTSVGMQIVPVMENQFLMCASNNADGNVQMYLGIVNPEGHRVNGTDGGGGAIGNGASLYLDWQYKQLDTPYTSTNYPVIVASSNWFGGSR